MATTGHRNTPLVAFVLPAASDLPNPDNNLIFQLLVGRHVTQFLYDLQALDNHPRLSFCSACPAKVDWDRHK